MIDWFSNRIAVACHVLVFSVSLWQIMTADWQARLDAAIDESAERMVALRRHLHAHPEPSGKELQTSLHLYQLFDEPG